MANILVVEDDPIILKFVVRILTARDHTVTSIGDGLGALEIAQRDLPDVIVLDINLPRMSGLSVCRNLKTDETTKHIGVVLMTGAYVSSDDARNGENCGADEYVVKPFLKEVLIHNVERLLVSRSEGSSQSEPVSPSTEEITQVGE